MSPEDLLHLAMLLTVAGIAVVLVLMNWPDP